MVVIHLRFHIGEHFALHNHLGADIGARFEQYRIHVNAWGNATSLCLDRLRSANFTAFGADCAVQCHVLRFERRHAVASALQNATKSGNERTFPGIRGGSLHHQGKGGGRLWHLKAPISALYQRAANKAVTLPQSGSFVMGNMMRKLPAWIVLP